MNRITVIVLKYKQISRQSLSQALDAPTILSNGITDVKFLEKASLETIKMLQQREFVEELKIIQTAYKKNLSIKDQINAKRSSRIYGRDPFFDDYGLLKVWG